MLKYYNKANGICDITERGVGIILGVVIVVVAAVVAWISLGPTIGSTVNSLTTKLVHNQPVVASQPNTITSNNVDVSGTITFTGKGINAMSILFTNTQTNQTYSTKVHGGAYSLEMPNFARYSAEVFWNGSYDWQSGVTPTPELTLQQVSSNATDNINLAVPDSLIFVQGKVHMTAPNVTPTGIVLRNATNIIFTSRNGEKFDANLTPSSGNLIYSLNLPNLMNYSVQIKYRQFDKSTNYCNSGTLNLYASQYTSTENQSFYC